MRAKTVDYFALSLPLILLAFAAAGVAVAMLTADLLAKLDVTEQVDQILEKEVLPMVDLLSGKDASDLQKMMTRMAVKGKAQGMVRSALPKAKRVLYAQGLAKLFVIELGPLLAALLLSGRLGGSYAGEVASVADRYDATRSRFLYKKMQGTGYPDLASFGSASAKRERLPAAAKGPGRRSRPATVSASGR